MRNDLGPGADSRGHELNPVISGLWLTANLALGLAPSVAFYIWIERNCTLPVIPLLAGWPWVNGTAWHVIPKLLWNTGLFAIFGVVHSALAQKKIQSRLNGWLPIQATRTIYMIATGFTVILIMGFWQHTGILVWAAPTWASVAVYAGPLLFWVLILSGVSFLRGQGFLSFFGFSQLFLNERDIARADGPPSLSIQGAYGVVRHPLYAFTLAAIALTPYLSLDRLWIFVLSCLYLSIGIPIEERKLVRIFGDEYRVYQRRVPAVMPAWPLFKKLFYSRRSES